MWLAIAGHVARELRKDDYVAGLKNPGGSEDTYWNMLTVFTLLLGAGPALAHPAVTAGSTVTLTVSSLSSAADPGRPAWSPLLPPPVAAGQDHTAAMLSFDRTPLPEVNDRHRRRDRKRRWLLLGGAAAVSAGGVLFMVNRPAAPNLEPVRFGVRWSIRGATAALVGNF
jgi:hypothetical protein